MIADQPATTHSADVCIDLLIAGQRLRVAQIGPSRLVFDHPVTLPAATGEVTLLIDGHPRRWHVVVLPGAMPSRVVQAEFSDIP